MRSRRRIFSSQREWNQLKSGGRVIITMDAWKKEKLTFAKALSMSEHNEKMRKYLNFILAKFGEHACEGTANTGSGSRYVLASHELSAQKGV